MSGQDYLEDAWDAVPEGAEPEAFAERRDFLLGHVRPGMRVLDVGCGEGAFSAALQEAGARPIALDVADEPLNRLRERFPQLDDVRRATAGEDLPVADGEVDVAWAGEVIEHALDAGALIRQLWLALKPGGVALVTTPDHPRRLRLKLALSDKAFDRHFWPHNGHVHFFTRRTLRDVLEMGGFEDVAVDARRGRLYAVARR